MPSGETHCSPFYVPGAMSRPPVPCVVSSSDTNIVLGCAPTGIPRHNHFFWRLWVERQVASTTAVRQTTSG